MTTRGSNTYGPYQYPEKIIPLFITNAIDDQPLPIYGDGGAVRDYIHVADHARGIDTALRAGAPGENYNVGYGGETNGVEVGGPGAGRARQAGFVQAARASDRLGHDRRYSVDSGKLRELGWRPVIPLDRGLRRPWTGIARTRRGGAR